MSLIQEENMEYSSKLSVRKRRVIKTQSFEVNKKVKKEERFQPENSDKLNDIKEERFQPENSDKLNDIKEERFQPENADKLNDIKEERFQPENADKLNDINLNRMRCDENLEINYEEKSEEDLKETLKESSVSFMEKTPSLPPVCHCVKCFVYMGEMNPRQYCRKFRCDYDFLNEKEMLQTQVFHLRSSPYYSDSTFYGYSSYYTPIQEFININYIKDLEEDSD